MTDAELKSQPRSVRDEFDRIENAEIDGDPEIARLKNEFADAALNLIQPQMVLGNIRECLKWLPSEIASTERSIEEITARRVTVIAMAFIQGEGANDDPDFADDNALLEKLRSAQLYRERLQLAQGGIQQQAKSASRAVELAAGPYNTIQERIAIRRDQLRLAEARRRAGY